MVGIMVFSMMACTKKEDTLVLGFVPFAEGENLVEEIKPLTDALSEKLDCKVTGYVATKYLGMVEGLGSGQIDFCFLPPTAYVLSHDEQGARAILSALNKHGEAFYFSQILARKDSGIRSVEDFKGKTFAFVEASSTSGYLYPYLFLKNHGVDPEKDLKNYVFSEGHDKSIDLLLKGDVDGAATFVDARKRFEKDFPNAMEDLVVLTETDPIPNISVAVSKDMSDAMAEKIRKALMEIAETEEGKELLSSLFNIYGFTAIEEEKFDPVRQVMETLGVGVDD